LVSCVPSLSNSHIGRFDNFWITVIDSQEIIKIDSTRCPIFRLKCTKLHFGWGSAPDPAGGAYSAPQTLWVDLRGPTPKGKKGEGRERKEWEGKEWGGKRSEGERKGEGRGIKTPFRIGLVTGLPVEYLAMTFCLLHS